MVKAISSFALSIQRAACLGKGGFGGHLQIPQLVFAAIKADLKRARFLLARGARVNKSCAFYEYTALMHASEGGHLEVVRELYEKGANVNTAGADGGVTALMCACLGGHLEVVRELCGRNGNVNAARTDDGVTALMDACLEGNLGVEPRAMPEECQRECPPNGLWGLCCDVDRLERSH